jgi:hypothetical protein
MPCLPTRAIKAPAGEQFYTAHDGRKLSVGRIFHASAGTARETPWFWSVEFAISAHHRIRTGALRLVGRPHSAG